ncbi:hypothetical protein E5288_WYG012940 [Bos mutus]|uniref:BPTI/Kunitz inhibitor domain-containing protein n=1 Tax=Bos mutus TaxID=72004 RepID=A0A6B0RCF7_9CETA|nr:hypothetical protein [Bos mutus]
MKMHQLFLSAPLLILLVILVDGTPDDINKSHDHASSRPSICLDPAFLGPCHKQKMRYFYSAKTRGCEVFIYGGCRGSVKMTGVQVWSYSDGTQQVPFFLQRTWEWSPENVKSEEDTCRAGLWLRLKQFHLLGVLSITLRSTTYIFPFLRGLHALILPHPVGSQHDEIMSSLYP